MPVQEPLKGETESLVKAWQQHAPDWLRDYLVQDVEDPRVNLQSILTRHFLVGEIFGRGPEDLMAAEYRFSAAMAWLREAGRLMGDEEGLMAVLHALRVGSDNAEGVLIPAHVSSLFRSLPNRVDGLEIPNYVTEFLTGANRSAKGWDPAPPGLDTFAALWRQWLSSQPAARLKVAEIACGSANDYRFWKAYGLADFVDYTGVDLTEANIANAHAMFPDVDFRVGNAFSLPLETGAYDMCAAQDLFEHLSLEGMEQAFAEMARITRRALCLGFFQMEETPDHILRPVEHYHVNLLSLARVKASLANKRFCGTAVHVGAFLRRHAPGAVTHNEQAYTLMVRRNPELATEPT